jgi:transposase
VDILLNDGYVIYPINPKSIERYKERYSVSGAKSDQFDANAIANALRTDIHRFHPVHPDSELLRELRILVADQERFIGTQTMLLNQLQACLKEYYPVALGLFSDLDSRVALEYLKRYPRHTRESAKKLQTLLSRHRHPHAEKKALEIAEALSKPQIPVDEYVVRARSRALLAIVEHLLSLREQIAAYQEEIEKLFNKHPDSPIFKNLPGSGGESGKNGPRLMTQLGDNRERFPSADSIQCVAGTSPVTRKSGKTEIILMRYACRKSFRNVMHQFAFCSLRQCSWARSLYDQQRAKDKSHGSALRTVGDKWLKIIFRLWKNGEIYNEDKFLASRMRQQLQFAAV